MIDVYHTMNAGPHPGMDVQWFTGPMPTTVIQWQTWRKPRGCKMIYMLAVGGGSSGGCGLNSGASSGGGAGGGSGAQSSLLIPAAVLPDELFIQAGAGGQQPASLVSAAVGVVGIPTYVCLEPTSLVAQLTILFANAGPVTGTAATTTVGGVAGSAAAVATIANMPFAGRGLYQFFAGQAGVAGGTSTTAGVDRTLAFQSGIIVTGGSGGGGSSATPGAGGQITGADTNWASGAIPNITTVAAAASGATPAGQGYTPTPLKFNMFYGGLGGGGASTSGGGNAGAGGHGGLGCGGGGAGGCNTTNTTLARPGNGGPGFVLIIAF